MGQEFCNCYPNLERCYGNAPNAILYKQQLETINVHVFDRGVFGLVAFLLGVGYFYFSFWQWRQERRQHQEAVTKQGQSNYYLAASRQSRRYQNSRLFESVLGPHISEQELSFQAFTDKFSSMTDLTKAMRRAGLERCRLIVGVDFTASNEWQGRRTFNRHCLHTTLQRGAHNPYQKVISTLGAVLSPFLETGTIFAFGFGDTKTRDHGVFPFRLDGMPCQSAEEVFHLYTEIARQAVLGGPTSFAEIIKEAMRTVKVSGGSYHLLIIVSDGQMGNDDDTVDALVEASNYPLSIVMVGVGDGPWGRMEEYDDLLPSRRFDNFQFVDFHRATSRTSKHSNPDTNFALHALMEVPDQYSTIKKLGVLKNAKVIL